MRGRGAQPILRMYPLMQAMPRNARLDLWNSKAGCRRNLIGAQVNRQVMPAGPRAGLAAVQGFGANHQQITRPNVKAVAPAARAFMARAIGSDNNLGMAMRAVPKAGNAAFQRIKPAKARTIAH